LTTIGLAMIVRNGAATMRAALDPLVKFVDEISIVFGGVSTDDTEAIAAEYTSNLAHYTGPLDATGRLCDFGAARQQASDMLHTTWQFWVDADDIWTGAAHLRPAIEKADAAGVDAVVVTYGDNVLFQQARAYRSGTGKWESPIHEFWQSNDGQPLKALITHATQVSQQSRSPEKQQERIQQNITLERAAIAIGYDTARIYEHLAQDCIIIGNYAEAVTAAETALTKIQNNPEQAAHVMHLLAMGLLYTERYTEAATTAIQGMALRDYGIFSAILCDAVQKLGAPPDFAAYLGQRAKSLPQSVKSYGYANFAIGNTGK